jgi:hypothetical protein
MFRAELVTAPHETLISTSCRPVSCASNFMWLPSLTPHRGPERDHLTGSGRNEHEVFNTPIGKVGLLICWDLAFPEAFRELIANGAKIMYAIESLQYICSYSGGLANGRAVLTWGLQHNTDFLDT